MGVQQTDVSWFTARALQKHVAQSEQNELGYGSAILVQNCLVTGSTPSNFMWGVPVKLQQPLLERQRRSIRERSMCHDINRVRLRHGASKAQKSRTAVRTHLRCWKRCHEGSSQIREVWGFSTVPGMP